MLILNPDLPRFPRQYYAEHLLYNNEGKKWRDPTSSPVAGSLPLDLQDDQIFNQARKINCAIFRKFVAEDLVKGLTGRSNAEEGTGLDFLKVLSFSLSYPSLLTRSFDQGSQGVHKDYQSSVESSLLYHVSPVLHRYHIDAHRVSFSPVVWSFL